MIRDSGSVKLYWALGSGLAVSAGSPAAAAASLARASSTFVATASPLIQGRHLLDAADWSRWQKTIENTVRRTATWEDGKVNWRTQLDSTVTSNDRLLMQFCHGAPGFVICLANLPGATLDDLLIATAKGQGSGPNNMKGTLKGERKRKEHPYIPTLIGGSIARLSLGEIEKNLPAYTKQVEEDNLLRANPGKFEFAGGKNPIHHVIYILKENRTYDQVLGDLPVGNGDASLTFYGAEITPNQHKLALQFGVLDNFYDSGEVSGDGHIWSTASITTDYNEKNWPIGYRSRERTYDADGTMAEALPLEQGIPDIDDPATQCQPDPPPYGFDMPGRVEALVCTDPGLPKGTQVYAYQLDNHADYEATWQSFNKVIGFSGTGAGPNCPPAKGGQARISEDDYIEGAPELVVEIVGSSHAYDLHQKKGAYRRNGVREYLAWITGENRLVWWELREGEYLEISADANGLLKSSVFPGLWLDTAALLRGDMKTVLATRGIEA